QFPSGFFSAPSELLNPILKLGYVLASRYLPNVALHLLDCALEFHASGSHSFSLSQAPAADLQPERAQCCQELRARISYPIILFFEIVGGHDLHGELAKLQCLSR